jgi:hypothetical protein
MKKSKDILLLMLAMALISFTLHGQAERYLREMEGFIDTRKGMYYLVPEAGLWFGTYTNIEVAPQLAYHLTDRWSVGAGPRYTFYQNNNPYSVINFSTHIWGLKAFSRLSIIREAPEILPFYLFDELFIHAEYERISLENQYFNAPSYPAEGRFWTDYFYIGAGISQRFSGYTSYSILFLWNLNDSMNSFYRNPTYRIGLSVYF